MPPPSPTLKHVLFLPFPIWCHTLFPIKIQMIYFFPAPFVWSDVRGYVHCTSEFTSRKKSKKELKQIELQNAQGIDVCFYVKMLDGYLNCNFFGKKDRYLSMKTVAHQMIPGVSQQPLPKVRKSSHFPTTYQSTKRRLF